MSILLLLQLHGRQTARQLAKRMEVSERTIHRDMGALGSAGVPVLADRGVGGGWRLVDGYRTSLTALSEPEIRSLFVSASSRLLADLGLAKAGAAAELKVTSLLPDVLRRNAELARQRIFVDAGGWKRADEAVPALMPLQDAVWRDLRVSFQYDRGVDGEMAERTADPLGLVAKGSVWYLVARVDGDVRTYRVSRIRSVSVLEESFERPIDFDLPEYWQRSATQFREQLPRLAVVVRAPKSAVIWMASMIRYGAIDGIETGEDGVCTVRMHFDAEEAAIHFLSGLGPVFDLVEPESLREPIAESARQLLARLLQK